MRDPIEVSETMGSRWGMNTHTWSEIAGSAAAFRGKGVRDMIYSHLAKIPFRPLREKLAEKPVLYGVLSLLKRT